MIFGKPIRPAPEPQEDEIPTEEEEREEPVEETTDEEAEEAESF